MTPTLLRRRVAPLAVTGVLIARAATI